ncbi:metallopeptidase mip1 [Grosmannia clavigera kw1407]|uniref:Mitochondrial intermediate peptidase n=1 Tax=Grosmannia clavigera (strain kw1407 / UAMH 11150) TaxID=655863 RepID=F0XD81_GROCL|nr:metallopeptidase mip1 [Grosmannia clavigera kw1407]EFX04017.1 metallopeptidase mip1 [Grosmannia clavigera kw1407]
MLKYVRRVRPLPWICGRCLGQTSLRQTQQRRPLSWTATRLSAQETSELSALPLAGSLPTDHRVNTGQERDDDAMLRSIFDSSAAWTAFSRAAKSRPAVGLFGNAYLTEPRGFLAFAQASLGRAQGIVDKVARASSAAEYGAIVRDLDQLSDLLCRVIDLCDFVRANAPDSQMQQAASDAWATAYQYMNQLNTTTVLADQLDVAMGSAAASAGWGEEEQAVAAMLKLDFAKSAVDLPQESRDRFVDLSQRISEVGTRFVETMAPAQARLDLPSAACRGLDPVVARGLTTRGRLRLPTASAEAALALRSVVDEDVRKAVYYASRTASPHTVQLLEQLLCQRAELAGLAGFDSYAHMALRDRMMARSPESVRRFLLALSGSNAPRARSELAELIAARASSASAPDILPPWDRDFYMRALRRADDAAAPRQKLLHGTPLSHYFSLGTVMQGLSRLLQRLYGLRLVPRATPPGETWHPDVRRLDVVSDTDGHVAVLYCDLFYRDDKSPNPAHFTVRCARTISPAELAAAADSDLGRALGSPAKAANDGMATIRTADGAVHQLPTIALVCDFARSGTGGGGGFLSRVGSRDRPALLSFHEVETLFHEMGHAVHSVLARTALQSVAGTRCATDLAELPSTLMEHFAADASVLALFARHYETDAPLDHAQVAEGLRRSRRFAGLDDENQIVLAMLDQAYHGLPASAAEGAGLDSTRIFHDLQRAIAVGPADPPGTCWQGFFGHLFGYGATYYSYLFDRVLADRVWHDVFAAGRDGAALHRDNGEHLRDSLLRWGGARDPWRCLSDALRDKRLAPGDEDAMALVGSWGTSNTFQQNKGRV